MQTDDNSRNKDDSVPKFCAKQPRLSDSLFLKIPPQAACEGVPAAKPSVLYLIQFKIEGCQITSVISGALGGWIVKLKAFKILNSSMEFLTIFLELFPNRETLAMIKLTADFQCKYLSENLN